MLTVTSIVFTVGIDPLPLRRPNQNALKKGRPTFASFGDQRELKRTKAVGPKQTCPVGATNPCATPCGAAVPSVWGEGGGPANIPQQKRRGIAASLGKVALFLASELGRSIQPYLSTVALFLESKLASELAAWLKRLEILPLGSRVSFSANIEYGCSFRSRSISLSFPKLYPTEVGGHVCLKRSRGPIPTQFKSTTSNDNTRNSWYSSSCDEFKGFPHSPLAILQGQGWCHVVSHVGRGLLQNYVRC